MFASAVGILSFLPAACPAQEKHAFTLAYLNDNFLLEDYLTDYFAKGKDDRVTAGFWLQYRRGTAKNNWGYSVNFNMLTNRDLFYRTDLLSLLAVKNRAFSLATLQTGVGLVMRGNFGGRQLQNKFHDWFGYGRIALPYLSDSQTGLLFHLGGSYDFLNRKRWHAAAYFAGNLVTSAAPGKMETGVKLKWNMGNRAALRLNGGYVRFFRTDKWLRPLFDHGPFWRVLLRKGLVKKLYVVVWMSGGQFGINGEYHYGLAFSINPDEVHFYFP